MNKNRVMNLGDYIFIRGNIPEVKRKVKIEIKRKDGGNIDIIEMKELENELGFIGDEVAREINKKDKNAKVEVKIDNKDGRIEIIYLIR